MDDRLAKLEARVEWLFVAQAKGYIPLKKEEELFVKQVQERIGHAGYNIVVERISMIEAQEKHEKLLFELRELENDYPKLKENK